MYVAPVTVDDSGKLGLCEKPPDDSIPRPSQNNSGSGRQHCGAPWPSIVRKVLPKKAPTAIRVGSKTVIDSIVRDANGYIEMTD